MFLMNRIWYLAHSLKYKNNDIWIEMKTRLDRQEGLFQKTIQPDWEGFMSNIDGRKERMIKK